MKHKIIMVLLVLSLALISLFVIEAGGRTAYDMQSLGLVFVRLNGWVLAVAFYQRLMAALGDDDVESDWDRINNGNMAVALYRVGELAVVGLAIAMLISKL